MKIIVLGAGAWGTALACAAATHAPSGRPAHQVTLWARDPQQAAALQVQRQNARYLPGVALPARLAIASGVFEALAQAADLVIVGTPMVGLRGTLELLHGCTGPVAWLCKGFESPRDDAHGSISGAVGLPNGQDGQNARDGQNPQNFQHLPLLGASQASQGLLAHEVCAQIAPNLRAGVLSGPSFAQEVAQGQPAALVAASQHSSVRDALVQAFHGPSLRIYASDDIVGVEVGGAVKNLMAIATGLCDGLNLGLNARAAIITRGLAEMTRLGVALGARTETFMGLSGLGDLVLTATGDLSRNRKVGLLLAQGQNLQQVLDSLGHVAEGVYSARTVLQRAQALGVDMPITHGVVALLNGQLRPQDAVAVLMAREPVAELG